MHTIHRDQLVRIEVLPCTSGVFAKLEQHDGMSHKEPIRYWLTYTTHQGKRFIEGLTDSDLAAGYGTVEESQNFKGYTT